MQKTVQSLGVSRTKATQGGRNRFNFPSSRYYSACCGFQDGWSAKFPTASFSSPRTGKAND
eukprot:3108672-Amphidinium_carterae.1